MRTRWRILNLVFVAPLLALLLAAGCLPGTPASAPTTLVPTQAPHTATPPPTTTPCPATPSPTRVYHTVTPLPFYPLPSWLCPINPRERELFDRVRRAYYLAQQLYQNQGDPWEDFKRAYDDVFVTADDYLNEFPNTLAAAAVYTMMGNTYALGWSADCFLHHRKAHCQAIETYLMHPKKLDVPLLEGLKAIGLPIVWSQEIDVDGDTRPDTVLELVPQIWHGTVGSLCILRAPGQDKIVPHMLPTWYPGASDEGYDHSVYVWKIADINQDGRIEIAVKNWHAYAGGSGLCVDVFQWQGSDFVSILDWEGDDAYYGDAYMRALSGTEAKEIVVEAGKGWEWQWDWSRKLKKVRFYQWDGQRYVHRIPLPYSEYAEHSAEEANYYFFEAHDYAKALAKYKEAVERAHPGSWELPLEWRMNIIVCYKLLGDEANFQKAYAAFCETWSDWVEELDARLAKLKEGEP